MRTGQHFAAVCWKKLGYRLTGNMLQPIKDASLPNAKCLREREQAALDVIDLAVRRALALPRAMPCSDSRAICSNQERRSAVGAYSCCLDPAGVLGGRLHGTGLPPRIQPSRGRGVKNLASKAKPHPLGIGSRATGVGTLCCEAAILKLDAERKAGEMLEKMPKHKGGRPPENRFQDGSSFPATLESLGITDKQSFRWQAEARVPDQHYHAYRAGARFFPATNASQGAANPARL